MLDRHLQEKVDKGMKVDAHLKKLELKRYARLFKRNGFDYVSDLEDCTEESLVQLGMLKGHVTRFLRVLPFLRRTVMM